MTGMDECWESEVPAEPRLIAGSAGAPPPANHQLSGSSTDASRLPSQPLGFAQDLVEAPGDDFLAVLLPLLDEVPELLDLGLERLDLGLVAFLPLVELLPEDFAQLGLDLIPVRIRLGLAELSSQSVGLVRETALLGRTSERDSGTRI